MEKELISTNKAPAAIGPYSQAMKTGNMIFTSGQLGINPETGEFVNDNIQEETRQSLKNLMAIMEEAGGTFKDIVKVTIFIKDMENFSKINEVYEEYFSTHKPARSCVEISRLPKNGNVEVEAIAII
ncbi:RidA family protein [Anaerosalibacter massiliensis]|uniref:RidA family protein n=1 Tax=Anaerosalibacter massiliensis TaxID=1347392 RepID=A0A9X2S7Q6_9FIRM|nr:RidA family protein [Anaerosalibacter massiliensis]MCR2044987.1 RidA family protein [Anaerosalibacter massiliensis]